VRLVPFLTAVALALLIVCAGPARAQKIDTTLIRLAEPSGTAAYVAWPPGKAKAPVVIVVHEWWGLNSQIRSVARRLAAEGYIAIVPDLYHGKVTDDPEQAHVLARGVETPAALTDLDAAMAWLTAQPRAEGDRVGVMGFCMGGSIALEYGMHEPRLRAVVMFYGPPVTDAGRLVTLKAPVLAHFGQLDDGIPEDRINDFRLAMSTAGKSAEIHLYPGAGHAFMNEMRPSLHPESARRAWARTLSFLQKQIHD
jgi:carboxymethylenebutenolidase